MISTTTMSVPAGVPGRGVDGARPLGRLVGRSVAQPPFAGGPGTGLLATRVRGPVAVGAAVPGTSVPATGVLGTACTPRLGFTAQHDATTLGFHPSGRPLS